MPLKGVGVPLWVDSRQVWSSEEVGTWSPGKGRLPGVRGTTRDHWAAVDDIDPAWPHIYICIYRHTYSTTIIPRDLAHKVTEDLYHEQ